MIRGWIKFLVAVLLAAAVGNTKHSVPDSGAAWYGQLTAQILILVVVAVLFRSGWRDMKASK